MATRREQLAYMVGLMSHGGKSGLAEACEYGKSKGVKSRLHEGKEQSFFEEEDRTAEWLMGQIMMLNEYMQGNECDMTLYLMTFHAISNRTMQLLEI
ncbi:hypothetical protein BACERE00185_00089 [Bacillus mobilis]|uniref:Uncharacterized protein n=1 Tax=Bacillus mobilis TaxID=2026190 RepID=A0A1Y5YU04_9BACI|nr:hypothetical protein [Bacillus mobilis]SMD65991.1 hypothetical protein BACERE00185_00089 [Bacillus mobilis]